MWKLKRCPKCRGTVILRRDTYGPYLSCLRCGWLKDLIPGPTLPKTPGGESDREAFTDGCEVAASCFHCPLPDCVYEDSATRIAYA
jgi:hypothetical protein